MLFIFLIGFAFGLYAQKDKLLVHIKKTIKVEPYDLPKLHFYDLLVNKHLTSDARKPYILSFGEFSSRKLADEEAKRLKLFRPKTTIINVDGIQKYRLAIGPFSNLRDVYSAKLKLLKHKNNAALVENEIS